MHNLTIMTYDIFNKIRVIKPQYQKTQKYSIAIYILYCHKYISYYSCKIKLNILDKQN